MIQGRGEEKMSTVIRSEKKTPEPLKPEKEIVKKSKIKKAAQEQCKDMVQRKAKKKLVKKVVASEKKNTLSLKPEDQIVKKSAQEKGLKITHVGTGTDGEKTTKIGDKQLKNGSEKDGVMNVRPSSSQPGKRENHEENQVKNGSEKDGVMNVRPSSSQPGKGEKREESSRRDKKAYRNLGGLIFMCNRKTKSDCFRYQVMGVSTNKQDIVTSIRPGLYLFLYDFDLRLLYGIYKASSVGCMKLEPAAFGGAFPAQVRFQVHKDCLPLPQSVFKNAIKDNYDEKLHKFKTELTTKQVRNLQELFQPVQRIHPDANYSVQGPLMSIRSLPVLPLPGEEAHHEILYRDHQYISGKTAVHHIPSDHEKKQVLEQHIPRSDVASHNPLFLSEKEYRSYGLRGERNNPLFVAALDPFQSNREQPQMHPSEAVVQKDTKHHDELFFSEKEYRTYGLRGRSEVPQMSSALEYKPPLDSYSNDLYNPYHDSTASLVNRYLSIPMPVAGPEFYNMAQGHTCINDNRSNPGRVAPYEGEKLYTTYASSSYHHLGDEAGSRSTPVSSRYSFAGPSVSYR